MGQQASVASCTALCVVTAGVAVAAIWQADSRTGGCARLGVRALGAHTDRRNGIRRPGPRLDHRLQQLRRRVQARKSVRTRSLGHHCRTLVPLHPRSRHGCCCRSDDHGRVAASRPGGLDRNDRTVRRLEHIHLADLFASLLAGPSRLLRRRPMRSTHRVSWISANRSPSPTATLVARLAPSAQMHRVSGNPCGRIANATKTTVN